MPTVAVLPKADLNLQTLPDEIKGNTVRRRAVRLLHMTLECPVAALRLESSLHTCTSNDKYLLGVNKFAFALRKPEMLGLKKRIILESDLDLAVQIKKIL